MQLHHADAGGPANHPWVAQPWLVTASTAGPSNICDCMFIMVCRCRMRPPCMPASRPSSRQSPSCGSAQEKLQQGVHLAAAARWQPLCARLALRPSVAVCHFQVQPSSAAFNSSGLSCLCASARTLHPCACIMLSLSRVRIVMAATRCRRHVLFRLGGRLDLRHSIPFSFS